MRIRLISASAALAALALVPSEASAATHRTSFQMTQLTPPRAWADTSFIPFALPTSFARVYRYRVGSETFVGTWVPAAAGAKSTSDALGRVWKDATSGFGFGSDGVIADRELTGVEKRRFIVLGDLYRDADVLVLAAGHPACAGLTRGQARSIARGAVTRWSQVVAGAGAETIRVRHPVNGFGEAVPHMGTTIVGKLNRQRVTYAPAAVGLPDAGVSLAAGGDQSIAAITTWARVRALRGSVCVVPLGGVAPTDATVSALRYPEAFPVRYVVTRRLVGRSAIERARVAAMRRAMAAHLESATLKALLRTRGVILTGDPLPPAAVEAGVPAVARIPSVE